MLKLSVRTFLILMETSHSTVVFEGYRAQDAHRKKTLKSPTNWVIKTGRENHELLANLFHWTFNSWLQPFTIKYWGVFGNIASRWPIRDRFYWAAISLGDNEMQSWSWLQVTLRRSILHIRRSNVLNKKLMENQAPNCFYCKLSQCYQYHQGNSRRSATCLHPVSVGQCY